MKCEPDMLALDAKLAFLRTPSAYPEDGTRIEALETHMSWVFLTDRFAYKLKKPVRYAFLDFSTLAARERDCVAEVELNRRLAGSVYLGVTSLRVDDDGKLNLNGRGTVVDWLVRMRRLPTARMLDSVIREGNVRADDIDRFALLMVDFYARSTPQPIAPGAYRHRFEEDIRTQCSELARPGYGLPAEQIARICEMQSRFVSTPPPLLESRACRVVDGHGDLRPEHVLLGDNPVVIDCLEFDRALRLLDPADELAYLALECERLGARHIGEQVLSRYQQSTGDVLPAALLGFYKSFRACVRAQLAIWHTTDRTIDDHAKWHKRARDYLNLAEAHLCGA